LVYLWTNTKLGDPSKEIPPQEKPLRNANQIPQGAAFFIAALVTLSSLFTYYVPDNLPKSNVIADPEANYDFWRFIGGTYVGALLALLGGTELAKKYERVKLWPGRRRQRTSSP